MIKRYPANLLSALRRERVDGDDTKLSLYLGFYLQMFGITEVNITTTLAYVLDYTDFKRADIVMRGMDARVKCERLRRAAKAYKPLGPNFRAQLTLFEQDCLPLRNKLSHCWPLLDTKTQQIYFATIGSVPEPGDEGALNFKSMSETVHVDDLLSQGFWLNAFSVEIIQALNRAHDGESLEIVDPIPNPPK